MLPSWVSSWCYKPGNTKGGSITVPLTSCYTGLESAVWQQTIFVFYLKNTQIQTSQTGGQRYSDPSPFSITCTNTLAYLATASVTEKKSFIKMRQGVFTARPSPHLRWRSAHHRHPLLRRHCRNQQPTDRITPPHFPGWAEKPVACIINLLRS